MRRLRSSTGLMIAATLLALAAPAGAQTQAWARMAEEDLAAARALIVDHHPGAAAEVGDRRFQQQLQQGYAAASQLARSAASFGQYRAALIRFAAAFDDPHIQTDPLVQADLHWPGFRVANVRGRWTVTHRTADGAPDVGAVLLSCEGRSPDDLLAARLAPFTPFWRAHTQRMRASSALLLDRGEGLPRLGECSFAPAGGGQARPYRLNWSRISPSQHARQTAPAPRPASASADIGLTPFRGGWWLRLGNSGSRAMPLLSEARERRDPLRAAPFVVLDLRGNDGGASFFTDELAKLIYGEARVARARRPSTERGGETIVWRASPAAAERLASYRQRVSRMASPDHPMALGLAAQHEAVRRAVAAGEPIARAPAEVRAGAAAPADAGPSRPPRVVLITDRWCFSSCLMGAHLFRQLGALHAGEETSANTRYSDLMTIDLPSGLSTFSTMQSYSTYMPMDFGPYRPTAAFEGDLDDDAAVQEWVARTLLPRS